MVFLCSLSRPSWGAVLAVAGLITERISHGRFLDDLKAGKTASVTVPAEEIGGRCRDPVAGHSLRHQDRATKDDRSAGTVDRAIAGEAGAPFYPISGCAFVEMRFSVGVARARDFFDQARKAAPFFIFIDEMDALGCRRGNGGFGGRLDDKEQTLNHLPAELASADVAGAP